MQNLFNITNHELTQEQKEAFTEGDHEKNVKFIELPPELKKIWGNIPVDGDIEDVKNHLSPVIEWLNNHELVNSKTYMGLKYALVAGAFSATSIMIEVCQALGIGILEATTKREVVEETLPDGTVKKTAVFKFVQFREIKPVIETQLFCTVDKHCNGGYIVNFKQAVDASKVFKISEKTLVFPVNYVSNSHLAVVSEVDKNYERGVALGKGY